ncbi:hypothetical protein P3541_24930, partial [Vibrio parahaemolyticus]|nr:hypothetical protein [Vibrio parahaemolyticus]
LHGAKTKSLINELRLCDLLHIPFEMFFYGHSNSTWKFLGQDGTCTPKATQGTAIRYLTH